jgi:hypothetical protein
MTCGIPSPSLLLQQGESPVYVKEQMGHSSIQVTVDLYGHLIPGGNKQAVDRLDQPVDKAGSEAESATQTQPPHVDQTTRPWSNHDQGLVRQALPLVAGGGFEPPTFGL